MERDPLDPFIQEYTNIFLTALIIVLLVIVGRYLIIEGTTEWRRARFKLGLSIGMTLLGLGIRFGWVAVARLFENGGHSIAWMNRPIIDGASLNVIVPLVSTVIVTWGLLCKIHTLAPKAWGRFAWMACVAFALLVTGVFILAR